MQRGLVRFAIVFLLFQCIQGTIRHLNDKLPWQGLENADFIYRFEEHSDIFLRSDDKIANDELSKLLRTRRQAMGDTAPEANPSYFIGDDRPFGRVMYSGEGSKVNHKINTFIF